MEDEVILKMVYEIEHRNDPVLPLLQLHEIHSLCAGKLIVLAKGILPGEYSDRAIVIISEDIKKRLVEKYG